MEADKKGMSENEPILQAISNLEANEDEQTVKDLINVFKSSIEEGGQLMIPVLKNENILADNAVPEWPAVMPRSDYRKVELLKGGMALVAFTSLNELDKGQQTDYISMSISEYLTEAFNDDQIMGIVINPWGISVLLDKYLLALILGRGDGQTSLGLRSTMNVDKGNITRQKVDAIVNWMHSLFKNQEDMNHEIISKAGAQLEEELNDLKLMPSKPSTITLGYDLPSKYIIHLENNEDFDNLPKLKQVEEAIYTALDLAEENEIHTIALPVALSADEKIDPLESAVYILKAIGQWTGDHTDYAIHISLVCYDDRIYQAFRSIIEDPDSDE